jgi:hypothetical protein
LKVQTYISDVGAAPTASTWKLIGTQNRLKRNKLSCWRSQCNGFRIYKFPSGGVTASTGCIGGTGGIRQATTANEDVLSEALRLKQNPEGDCSPGLHMQLATAGVYDQVHLSIRYSAKPINAKNNLVVMPNRQVPQLAVAA